MKMNKWKPAVILLAAAMLFAMPRPVLAAGSTTQHSLNGKTWTDRTLSGSDRYKTAAVIGEAYSEAKGAAPSEALLVTGQNFPDALSAGALAGVKGCPIILSRREGLPQETKTLLTQTWGGSVKTVTMVGAGFSGTVTNDLKACGVTKVDTTSFGGSDRYKTAELVAKAVQASGATMCAVATGWTAADSLSISSWSYALKMPIILTKSNGELTGDSLALAKTFEHVYILGGTGAVAASTEVSIGDIAERLSGNDRFETSRNIALHFLKERAGKANNFQDAVLAKGANANFPDALVGGPLAGLKTAPVVLIRDSGVTDRVRTCMREGISNGYMTRLDLLGAAAVEPARSAVVKQLS